MFGPLHRHSHSVDVESPESVTWKNVDMWLYVERDVRLGRGMDPCKEILEMLDRKKASEPEPQEL